MAELVLLHRGEPCIGRRNSKVDTAIVRSVVEAMNDKTSVHRCARNEIRQWNAENNDPGMNEDVAKK